MVQKEGFNPKLGQAVTTTRRRIRVDRDLPMAEEYGSFVAGFLEDSLGLVGAVAATERAA